MRVTIILGVLGLALGDLSKVYNPVTPVIKLLKELQAKVKSDEKTETKSYNKMACWCENTSRETADALVDDEKQLKAQKLKAGKHRGIEEAETNTANDADAEIRKIQKEMAEATDKRAARKATNNKDIDEASRAAESVRQAVEIMAGAGTGKAALIDVKGKLMAHAELAKLAKHQMETLNLLLSNDKSFLQAGYTPQSGAVQGIMKNMYETFSSNVQETSRLELEQCKTYEDRMKLWQRTVEEQTKILKQARQAAATAGDTASEAESLWASTNAQYREDQIKFDNVKQTCKDASEQWATRREARGRELRAIKEGLTILDSDETRAMMAKSDSGAVSFIQTDNHLVSAMLSVEKFFAPGGAGGPVAKKGGWKINDVIDEMIQDLKDEGKDDQDQRDECIKMRHEQSEIKNKEDHEVKRETAAIASNEATIDELNTQIEATNKQLEDTRAALQDAQNIRDDEKADYEERRATDKKAVEVLTDALNALNAFYAKKSLIQAPDGKFETDQAPEFKNRAARQEEGNAVVALITQIIENTQADMKKDKDTENANNAEFEGFKKDSEDTIANLEQRDADLNSSKAKESSAKQVNEGDKSSANGKSEAAQKTMDDDKESCDFIMENFEKRIEARTNEIEGLENAKATINKATHFAKLDK